MTTAPRLALGTTLAIIVGACSSLPADTGSSSDASTSSSSGWHPPSQSASSSASGSGGMASSSGSGGWGGSTGTTSSSGSGGSGGMAPCTATVPGPPGPASYPFTLGGQAAWSHDDGFPGGFFHTYDGLQVAGPSDAPRKVHVFLPRDYDPCGPRYPVVYFNDGNTTFWPGGIGNKTWDVADALGELWAGDAVPALIAVAIEPINREREYTHAPWADGHDCCGVEEYTGYVADHVKAFIDQNYHTRTDAPSTAIIGSSHGGLAAFYMANRRPDVFGKAGCLSPSFWAGLDPVHGGTFPGGPLATSPLVQTLKATLESTATRPRVWIDWGLVRDGQFHNSVIEAAATTRGKEMVGLLQGTYGYVEDQDLFWAEDPLGEHDEISWGRRFPDVMKALFGPM
ncbi:Putative esterase [Minicystis rosea]|nr:Putative esterase [Minicystis rosea]